jgi:hypothetical protein
VPEGVFKRRLLRPTT